MANCWQRRTRAWPGVLVALTALLALVLATSSGTNAAVATFTVDTIDGSYDGSCLDADCSLSDAIWEANGNVGKDTIAFDIDGTGPHVIVLPAPGTPLPAGFVPSVTDAVVIDGETEPDYADIPVVEIDGNGRGRALVFSGDETSGSEVRGLAINNTVFEAIQLSNPGGNIVERNFIGTDASGTVTRETGRGIALLFGGSGSPGSVGNTVADNLIAPIGGDAISLNRASDSHVLRNLIGTDISGKIKLSNGSGDGIRVVGTETMCSGTSSRRWASASGSAAPRTTSVPTTASRATSSAPISTVRSISATVAAASCSRGRSPTRLWAEVPPRAATWSPATATKGCS